jgi:surface protein
MSGVTEMTGMFGYAVAFNNGYNPGEPSGLLFSDGKAPTSKIKKLSGLFNNAFVFNGNISNWDVSAVTDMSFMFLRAKAFNNGYAPNEKYILFPNYPPSNGKLSTTYITFGEATAFNGNVSNWDMSAVTNMSFMFENAIAFNQDIGSWLLKSVIAPGLEYMFDDTAISIVNYDAILNGWANKITQLPNNLTLGANGLKYSSNAISAHNQLTSIKGWKIKGDMLFLSSPTNVYAVLNPSDDTSLQGSVTLYWTAPTEYTIDTFLIYVYVNGVKQEPPIISVINPIRINYLYYGNQYAFTVTARNNLGDSLPSVITNPIVIQSSVLSAPIMPYVMTTSSTDIVTMYWVEPVNHGKNITGHSVTLYNQTAGTNEVFTV